MQNLPEKLINDLKAGRVVSFWVNPNVAIENIHVVDFREKVAN